MDGPSEKRPHRRRWLVVLCCVGLLVAAGQIFLDRHREEEKDLRLRFRKAITARFPDQAAEFKAALGLQPFDGSPHPAAVQPVSKNRTVILIHGLDDPGNVWVNLAPALSGDGFRVWLMNYPNDQPIVDSAWFFYDRLQAFRRNTGARVTIVAHSMGGLVSRQMLTDPEIGYVKHAAAGIVPLVDELIMVGTPNHGSALARFRLLTEVRDQLTRLAKGDGHWLGGILDGAGEAEFDLLPGSPFLENLNRRPHPEGVRLFLIAGTAAPWNQSDIDRLLAAVAPGGNAVPATIEGLRDFLLSMTKGLGDGLVTVDSVRLAGIPLRTVEGTHLSIIRNLTTDGSRVPPAIPLILERLHNA